MLTCKQKKKKDVSTKYSSDSGIRVKTFSNENNRRDSFYW